MSIPKGFTLIELLIVITVLGIIMAIAIPTHRDFLVRAKVAEGINLAAPAKAAMSDFMWNKSRSPISNASAGLPAPTSINGKYVASVDVSANPGSVTVRFNGMDPRLASSSTLIMSSSTATGAFKWKCKSNTISPQYLPAACRN